MSNSTYKIAIIIPAYNRKELLLNTLKNASRAIQNQINAQIIVVDDGSNPSLQLAELLEFNSNISLITQTNQGSISARINALKQADSEYILFLDSDDLINTEKFSKQLLLQIKENSDISYCNFAFVNQNNEIASYSNYISTKNHLELFLRLQPPPHVNIYKTSYLKNVLNNLVLPINRKYDAVGDIWFYYNLLLTDASISFCPDVLSYVTIHTDGRYSDCWEDLGLASLTLVEDFINSEKYLKASTELKKIIAECAFNTWRRLPHNSPHSMEARWLKIWRSSPRPELEYLGGKIFQNMAKIIGSYYAGWILKKIQRPKYSIK
jgi:glycosyltransferase involved in cell wall biosynthesis